MAAAVATTLAIHDQQTLLETSNEQSSSSPGAPSSRRTSTSRGEPTKSTGDGEELATPIIGHHGVGNEWEGDHGLEDASDEGDRKIIQDIYYKVKHSKAHVDNYIALLSFLIFTIIYLIILYLQADSFKTYEVSTAHMALLPNGLTGEGGFNFASSDEVYDWLNESIAQVVWQDPNCGNGICDRPEEFQAFGRFGCPSDCGFSANVSQITVTFNLTFNSDAEMQSSSWNLCMQRPAILCWYEDPVFFSSLLGSNKTVLNIPDGDWTLVVNAPFGGVVGSVEYGSDYAWESTDAVKKGATLVTWGNCAANQSETNLEKCRQAAGTITQCAEKLCTAQGAALDTVATSTAFFVDLVGLCNSDMSALNQYEGKNCSQIAKLLTENTTAGFESVTCSEDGPPGSISASTGGRRLHSFSNWGFLPHAHPSPSPAANPPLVDDRRMLLAELNSTPADFTTVLWTKLGPTDSQRLFSLRAATQRALYTWVGHACLANIPLPVSIVVPLAGFLCAFFGGPATLEGCTYTSTKYSTTPTTDGEFAKLMGMAHVGLNISREQEDAFIEIFLNALQSVLKLDASTVVAFSNRLHALDTEIVDAKKYGCPYVASVLPWTVGQSHTSDISVGDSITWVWEDDQPHSITEDTGLGDSPDQVFVGMGTGRLVVSRNSVCSMDNIGPGNWSIYPLPCVLQAPGTAVNTYSYTKYFKDVGTVKYVDLRNGGTRGVVNVRSANSQDELSIGSLARQCAPGCTLGRVRNGGCNQECNVLECAFDGGDCSCSSSVYGVPSCSCPDGQTQAPTGACCEAVAVGVGLSFPFSLRTWGPNATINDANFLPQDGPPLFRYVAIRNRVLVGMAISQKRWASEACKNERFSSLYPNCTLGKSVRSYGVNPVFLPKSVLYNAYYAANDSAYYSDFSLGFDNATLRNSQGIPYGFDRLKSKKATFHYIMDINFNQEQALESLQYMRDGFFMDNATKEVTVQLLTYNGIEHKFTLFEVMLTFQPGGKIPVTYNIQSVNAQPYRTALDWFRCTLEIILVVCVMWNVVEEVKECIALYKLKGSILAHFKQLWNIIDLMSLTIIISGIILWIQFVVDEAQPFNVALRYDIYDIVAWQAEKKYWDVVPPGSGFDDALAAFSRVEKMVYFRTYYVAIQGINILLMVLRILKLMDFQPRMGTITRTLAAAAPDLIHFFILFFVVFFGFAMYGHVVFGRTLDQFRTLPVALVTCFSSMLGNDSVNDYLMQLHGWELLAAVIFWWSYILIMVFIIFNLLIAIVVEAFMKVREDMEEAPSMPSEVVWIAQHLGRRMLTPVRTDKALLQHLRVLGASTKVRHEKSLKAIDSGEGSLRWDKDENEEGEEVPQEEVLKVDDREMDAETLEATFERVYRRAAGSKLRLRSTVTPKVLTDVVFNQFKQGREHQDESFAGEEGTKGSNGSGAEIPQLLDLMKTLVEKVSAIEERLEDLSSTKSSK